jgi:hypothetical protein
MEKEKDIKKAILDYLRLLDWFCWSNYQTMGSYKGVSDITATKDGITLWIEVKTKTGIQSQYQEKFEKDIKNYGGHYLIARSVEDVADYIEELTGVKTLLFGG